MSEDPPSEAADSPAPVGGDPEPDAEGPAGRGNGATTAGGEDDDTPADPRNDGTAAGPGNDGTAARPGKDGTAADPGKDGTATDPGDEEAAAGPSGGAVSEADEDPTGGAAGEADDSFADNPEGEATESDGPSSDEGAGIRSVPWLYLLGVLVFVASLGAFSWDLVTGHAVGRSLVTNALGTILLIAWAGYDSYRDSDSGVATRGGAIGTGLILVGIYLFVAGLVVALTSLFHGRTVLGLAMVAGSVPLVLVGLLSYPTGDVPDEREDTDEVGTTTSANGTEGEG